MSTGSGTEKPSSLKRITRDSSLILADELHKPVIKKFNKRNLIKEKYIHNLKIIYGE